MAWGIDPKYTSTRSSFHISVPIFLDSQKVRNHWPKVSKVEVDPFPSDSHRANTVSHPTRSKEKRMVNLKKKQKPSLLTCSVTLSNSFLLSGPQCSTLNPEDCDLSHPAPKLSDLTLAKPRPKLPGNLFLSLAPPSDSFPFSPFVK